MRPSGRRVLGWVILLALLGVTFVARTFNKAEVFYVGDQMVYFIEGDCYSRMTRARMVEQGQWVIRHHEFENYPQGITPHTTAPLDWTIVGLKKFVHLTRGLWDAKGTSPYRTQELDLAGAWISPLFGLITACWLWWWSARLRLPYRELMVALFAVSTILADGTLLGRPDHQSLLILLLAVAVGAELALADVGTPARLAKRWAVAAGAAWGLALWVSLYEPLVFFVGAMGRHFLFNRTALFAPAVRGRWLVLAGIVVAALLIDGWRMTIPDAAVRKYFSGWSSTIQELHHLDLRSWRVWHWTGLFGLGAFVLLGLAARSDPRAWSLLMLVALMLALTMWQVRWGYFLALAVAFSIPWQLGALKSRAWGWVLGIAALWPPAHETWARWHPTEPQQELRSWRSFGQGYWRRLAEYMRSAEKRPFLAPWWVSPQLAYWSGQPGVAGTSHQSLAGIVDTANFYLTSQTEEAAEILQRRGVKYVLIDDVLDPVSEDLVVLTNSEQVLLADNVMAAIDPYGELLGKSPEKAPPFLRFVTPRERGLVQELKPNPDLPEPLHKLELYRQQFLDIYIVVPEKFPAKAAE